MSLKNHALNVSRPTRPLSPRSAHVREKDISLDFYGPAPGALTDAKPLPLPDSTRDRRRPGASRGAQGNASTTLCGVVMSESLRPAPGKSAGERSAANALGPASIRRGREMRFHSDFAVSQPKMETRSRKSRSWRFRGLAQKTRPVTVTRRMHPVSRRSDEGGKIASMAISWGPGV
ncbi:hypothetical protein C8Q80DRAFT_225078 [Daedaleopsis nitida]|nr:hypothetical protein C8Q80DRAFT_225078 [Daedaleopsis nitida]